MIFVINNMKYDTDKMELISDKCEHLYSDSFIDAIKHQARNVKLWKSVKGNWLLTYDKNSIVHCGESIKEVFAKALLIKYDLSKYEELFGELEEA